MPRSWKVLFPIGCLFMVVVTVLSLGFTAIAIGAFATLGDGGHAHHGH
jgi:hypothetical protein